MVKLQPCSCGDTNPAFCCKRDMGDGCTEFVCCMTCFKRTKGFTTAEQAASEWNEATQLPEAPLQARLSRTITTNPCAIAAKDIEPVFILLGRDPDAEAAVRHWAELREARLGKCHKTVSARERADEMAEYRQTKV